MLNTYLTRLRNLLYDTDPNNQKFTDTLLTQNINLARKKVAAKGQCIRYQPPTSAGVDSISVLNVGSGYAVAPVITISAPDKTPGLQAAAVAVLSGNEVGTVTMTEPGRGYFLPPSISFGSSALGTTALASANLGYINQTYAQQQKYSFSTVQLRSGMDQILSVRASPIIWGQMRYTPALVSYSRYQAQVANYVPGITGPPSVMAQFDQGVEGTLCFYPIPDQPYQMEWDCLILPIDLVTNDTPEAIPDPWRFTVPYFAAFITLDGVGRYDDAQKMMSRFDMFMKEARTESQVGQMANWYGRSPS